MKDEMSKKVFNEWRRAIWNFYLLKRFEVFIFQLELNGDTYFPSYLQQFTSTRKNKSARAEFWSTR